MSGDGAAYFGDDLVHPALDRWFWLAGGQVEDGCCVVVETPEAEICRRLGIEPEGLEPLLDLTARKLRSKLTETS